MTAKEYAEKHAKSEGDVMRLRLEQAHRAGMERAAEIATAHAMERGPSHDYGMGGHKIAETIRAEASK